MLVKARSQDDRCFCSKASRILRQNEQGKTTIFVYAKIRLYYNAVCPFLM